MKRHLYAYLIIITVYYIPPMILNPTGWLYFVSIAAWSWISVVLYLKFIKLRCSVILCTIEAAISVCAIIALCEYCLLGANWYFYANLELIVDLFIIIEILVITISLIGAAIGIMGISRYNKLNRPLSPRGINTN